MHYQNRIVQLTQITLLICLLTATGLVQAKLPESWHNQAIKNGQQIQNGQTPDGLSTLEWTSIQQQISKGKYRAYPNQKGGYNSSNPAHGWQIRYKPDGLTTLTPRDTQGSAYHLGVTLSAIGYQTLQHLDRPQKISAVDATVTYQWNDNLKEWWINSPTRLEQWFSLEQRPDGANSGQPLTLQMTLDSELQARQSGNSIYFTHANGTKITYNKLKVWDTSGRALPARMQLANNVLSLIVDDNNARYPLTIDPSFQQQDYLKASNAETNDRFGVSVAIAGDTVVVGAAFGEDSNATTVNGDQSDNSASDAGAAYVFTRTAGVWAQEAYLKASNADSDDQFGNSVAIAGDTVVVGAFGDDSNATTVNGDQNDNSASNAGAAYVFTRTAGVWTQEAYLKATNAGANDLFGIVAIADDTVVVGAFAEDSNTTTINGNQSDNSASTAGAVYVFTRATGIWTQQAYLKASNAEAGDSFGFSVDIAGDTLVVGAFAEASNAMTVNGDQSDNSASNAGAAYVFNRTASVWTQQAYLKASNANTNDQFGTSIAIAGDTVVVGAEAESSNANSVNGNQADNSASNAGAAYIFNRTASDWTQQAYLKASNSEADDQFGTSVAISGDTVIVGADAEDSIANTVNGDEADNSASAAGAAYVYTRTAGDWTQQDYLKATNAGTDDAFGVSVAIDNETAVIGAIGEASNATDIDGDQTDNSASNAGAAYVFNLEADVVDPTDCTLDADGNASADALTDGLLFIRYLFGLRDDSLILDAVASDCVNCLAAELEPILEQCGTEGISDVDGNGQVDALTDGLLIIRYLFGLRGDALIDSAVVNDCSRCTANEIENYLQGLIP